MYYSEHLRVWTLIICVFCSEKSSGHSPGRGAARTGAADDERGGQSKSGLSTQLPHPQHVQRGPRGHLHQGVRCQTLAGQRSAVIFLFVYHETRTNSVATVCSAIAFWSLPSFLIVSISLHWHSLSPRHSIFPVCITQTPLSTSFQ